MAALLKSGCHMLYRNSMRVLIIGMALMTFGCRQQVPPRAPAAEVAQYEQGMKPAAKRQNGGSTDCI